MIQRQLKLKLTKKQEAKLESWLLTLTSIWNWTVRKIELNANNKIYFSKLEIQNSLVGISKRLEIPSHIIQGMLGNSHLAWDKCFKKISGKPKLKGHRNKLSWIPFPDPIVSKNITANKIRLLGIGSVKFHKQEIPEGKIKCSRIIKRTSGWYLCLIIDAKPNEIKKVSHNQIGIDPGYSTLITCSNGEKVEHPKELQSKIKRISQAQRGINRKLVARTHERIKNQKKDRNHKLSRRLVAENDLIAFSKDNLNNLAKIMGKSVQAANHGQLRSMLKYKSSNSGTTTYLEVSNFNSTRTCNVCGAIVGPKGRAGLSVRVWTCSVCGSSHDRDVNAAINTLKLALGSSDEAAVKAGLESGSKLSEDQITHHLIIQEGVENH